MSTLGLNELFDKNDENKKNNFLNEKFKSIDLKKYDLINGNPHSKIKELKFDLPKENLDQISKLIEEVKGSNKTITEASKQCIDFIQLAEKGVKAVNEKSGFFSRIWGAITGGTERAHIQNEQHLVNAQKAAVQIINEMNKQMLLTQEQILMLENLIRYMIKEEDDFRVELKNRLKSIFNAVKARFELIEKTIYDLAVEEKNTREIINEVIIVLKSHGTEINKLWERNDYLQNYVLKVERQVATLEWAQLIDAYANEYDQWKNDETKILLFFKTVFEFYEAKQGNFTLKDLLILSVVLRKLGFTLEENFTLENFFNSYVEQFFPNYFETVTRFLKLDTDQNIIDKIIEDGYFVISSDKTQFITTLNVVNQVMLYNKPRANADDQNVEQKKERVFNDISNFNNNNVLRLDASIDWFLLANELLTYKRMKAFSDQLSQENVNKKIYEIIEKGKSNSEEVFEDVKELILNKFAMGFRNSIASELVIALGRMNYPGISSFTDQNSDPVTFIKYAENIKMNQLEVKLNEDTYIGVYAKVENNKLIVSSLISIYNDGEHPVKIDFAGKGFDKIKLHELYDSFGLRKELPRADSNINDEIQNLVDTAVSLLNTISKG